MDAARPDTVVVVPVPVEVTAPGFRVRVQVPEAGSPERAMLPVATEQVGWVTVPITGADGVTGCALRTALPEAAEVQPAALVTVKVYDVAAASPDTVVVVPVPVEVTDPGFRVSVQVPVAGRPERAILPVANAQVGCVIVPMTGADGVDGCAFRTALADATEVHPAALVKVNV